MVKANVDKILEVLKQDKNASAAKISHVTGIPKEDVLKSAQYLEEDGVVRIDKGFAGTNLFLLKDPDADTGDKPVFDQNNVTVQQNMQPQPSQTNQPIQQMGQQPQPQQPVQNAGIPVPPVPQMQQPIQPQPPQQSPVPVAPVQNLGVPQQPGMQNMQQPVPVQIVNPQAAMQPQQPGMVQAAPGTVPGQPPQQSGMKFPGLDQQPMPQGQVGQPIQPAQLAQPNAPPVGNSNTPFLLDQNPNEKQEVEAEIGMMSNADQQFTSLNQENQINNPTEDPLEQKPEFEMQVPTPENMERDIKEGGLPQPTEEQPKSLESFEDTTERELRFPTRVGNDLEKVEFLLDTANEKITNHDYRDLNVIYRQVFNLFSQTDSLSPNERGLLYEKVQDLFERIKAVYLIEGVAV